MLNGEQIQKVIAAELRELRGDTVIPEGVHTFSARVTLTVEGSVDKRGDQLYTPTVDIPLLATLARFAEKAGFVGPALINALTEAATDALELGEPVGNYVEHTKAALRLVRERLTSKLPKKLRDGQMRRAVRLTVEQVVPYQPTETIILEPPQ